MTISLLNPGRFLCVTIILAFACSYAVDARVQASQRSSPPKARVFETPKQAAEALIAAAEKFDAPALEEILGPGSRDIIHTDEPARDREIAKEFAARARQKMTVAKDPKGGPRAFLSIGNDAWPVPVPIVQRAGKWSFDAAAERQEILYRRIGRNELDAIQICRGFVEAQTEYGLMRLDPPGVNQYAQRIISTPGKKDGLAWQNPDGSWGGPIGENVARAIE